MADGRQLPIESVRVGDRVEAPAGVVCPSTESRMMRVDLVFAGPVHGRAQVLRAQEWLFAERWDVGNEVWLDDPEIGTTFARIAAVAPFDVPGGQGCLVMATVEHDTPSTTQILFVDGAVVESTPTHPFFVPELGAFVSAADIRPGSAVGLLSGGEVGVEAVSRVDDPSWVFNIEVDTAHSYGVGPNPLWVHNTCPAPRRAGVPSGTIHSPPGTPREYTRPSAAGPTAAQRRAVQGRPCVDCGTVAPRMVPDHIDPLVVEHYRTGSVDTAVQSRVDAVQAHCPNCSSEQGGQLSGWARRQRATLPEE
jgi:hypothetical protein